MQAHAHAPHTGAHTRACGGQEPGAPPTEPWAWSEDAASPGAVPSGAETGRPERAGAGCSSAGGRLAGRLAGPRGWGTPGRKLRPACEMGPCRGEARWPHPSLRRGHRPGGGAGAGGRVPRAGQSAGPFDPAGRGSPSSAGHRPWRPWVTPGGHAGGAQGGAGLARLWAPEKRPIFPFTVSDRTGLPEGSPQAFHGLLPPLPTASHADNVRPAAHRPRRQRLRAVSTRPGHRAPTWLSPQQPTGPVCGRAHRRVPRRGRADLARTNRREEATAARCAQRCRARARRSRAGPGLGLGAVRHQRGEVGVEVTPAALRERRGPGGEWRGEGARCIHEGETPTRGAGVTAGPGGACGHPQCGWWTGLE